ncbi:MAG TPA: carboxypeptidase M32, partial [Paracoccaceae bacterium]|nr:carboxypeptidase M32 [Paracoccaceae bacterium]
MKADEAQAALGAHLRETAALAQVAGLLQWDQEAVMPEKGALQRAEQAAALEAVLHARRADSRVPEWAAAIDGATLDPAGRVNLAEALRAHSRATRVPASLASALARLTSQAHRIWVAARRAKSFADFAPTLAEILRLKREEAACLTEPGADPYDALLEDQEPGMTGAKVAALLGSLRPGLVSLRERIAGTPHYAPAPRGHFPPEAQLALARELAGHFGYDWQAGRLDLVVHPFCSGTMGDVRITTRVDPETPFDCLYSTIHETGHAVYEQGLDPALAFTPAGTEASMGVHESQSRLFENQIGRSRAFCTWLFPRLRARFGDLGLEGPEALYRALNHVAPGFIRTEADEVHYNLHILMRFDLERALIAGDLTVADLEAAWNNRF